jgi:EAL and modified HD-GYP domain-containing signal transduction protein
VISGQALSPSAMRRLDLLTALTANEPDLHRVVALVTADPALSFRLLRATNSAASGRWKKVGSIRDAIVLLGLRRVREWVALMVVSDVCEATEDQLAAVLIRARLCQTVAEHLGLPPESGFTVGLLSGVADLMGQSVGELAHHLPLTADVAAALIRGEGRLGEVLTTVHSYERVDLGALGQTPVDSGELAQAYLSALGWSTQALTSLGDNRHIS